MLSELLTRYRALARVKARSCFLVGADREDVVQESMIGLHTAVRDYDPDLPAGFRAFAELCVTRQVITAIESATRHEHGPLNSYVCFDRPVGDDDGDRVLGEGTPAGPVGRRRRRTRPMTGWAAPPTLGCARPTDPAEP